jgi:hypothetical protein
MFNTTAIQPLNIAPYAANRVGLLTYANEFDTYLAATTQQPTLINKASLNQFSAKVNNTQADTFVKPASNNTTKVSSPENGMDLRLANRELVSNTSLRTPIVKTHKPLNFLA